MSRRIRCSRRTAADLRLDLPITLYEAALGGKVRVPTLDGAVELAIPPGTNSGRTFRLKGKGLKAKSGAGDLLATVRIMLPERTDEEFKELMKKWRDSNALRSAQGYGVSFRRSASRRGALQNRDRHSVWNGPGSATFTRTASGRNLRLLRTALVDLVVDHLGDRLEPVAVGRPAHHIGALVVHPINRGEAVCRP